SADRRHRALCARGRGGSRMGHRRPGAESRYAARGIRAGQLGTAAGGAAAQGSVRLAQPGREAAGLDALVRAARDLMIATAATATVALLLAVPAVARAATDAERVARVLAQTPLIDGHNDLPWEIRDRFGGDLGRIDLAAPTAG